MKSLKALQEDPALLVVGAGMLVVFAAVTIGLVWMLRYEGGPEQAAVHNRVEAFVRALEARDMDAAWESMAAEYRSASSRSRLAQQISAEPHLARLTGAEMGRYQRSRGTARVSGVILSATGEVAATVYLAREGGHWGIVQVELAGRPALESAN